LGVVVLGYFILWNVRSFYKYFLRPAVDLKKFGLKDGAWAVVTGASDGIGKAFAVELGKRGFNLLLISRTKSKLQQVAEEIRSKSKVRTEILAVDFASQDLSFYEDIKQAIDKCEPVGILVNNVGLNYPYPENYLETPKQLNDDIINVNVKGLNEMIRIVLPKMVQRKNGAIINLSSLSGVAPAPLLSTYSASKAYIDFFSLCLASEYKRHGIAIQSITPGMTVSNMSKIRKPSLLAGVATPESIVKGSLATLGVEPRWSPFWVHAIIEYVLVNILPLGVTLDKINGLHQGIKKKALEKIKREAKAQ